MPQESPTVQWDPVYIDRAPSTVLTIYVLFLLVACAVTLFNLVRVWRAVPPFSTKSPTVSSGYLKLLQACTSTFARWIGLIFLAWGLLTATTVYDLCTTLLLEKVTGRNQLLLIIRGFSTNLMLALFVILFIYVTRWHLLLRIERSRE